MTRIRFEDLPSTNTPRNATNLNKLNNVVISSTEPTTGEEVWFQKGKNLLDVSGISSTTINGITFTNNGNGTFTLNGTADGHAELYLLGNANNAVEIPGNYVYGGVDSNVKVRIVNGSSSTSSEGSSTAIDKSTSTKGYVEILVIWGTTVNNVVISPMLTMEEDNTFEPYINKKIYTKNDNGVYEIFYDESNIRELEIIDITDYLALESGFAISNGAIYKQGKHIFGQVTVTGTFTTTQVKIFTIPYFPKRYLTISGSIVTSDGEWGQAGLNAYVYIGETGAIQVVSPTNAEAIRFELNYCTN